MKIYLQTKKSVALNHVATDFCISCFFILNGLNPQLFNAEVNREWVVVAKR